MAVRLQIIGGGRMGEALLAGLVRAGWAPVDQLRVVETEPGRADALRAAHPGLDVGSGPEPADGSVLAVKPGDIEPAARAVAAAGAGRVLSIAAGVRLASLEAAIGGAVPVIRAMPNTPALVGLGASAIAAGAHAGDDDLAWAESILGAVGEVVRVPESLLDAVTGLSGSGPAYVFLVAEALIDAGVQNGLSPDVATTLVVQTLLGSGTLLAESDDGPEALRAMVTSPGGTTAAGVRVLEDRNLRDAIQAAVTAATERSRELGR